jgi:amyloid beta precursor protein binding protein 1
MSLTIQAALRISPFVTCSARAPTADLPTAAAFLGGLVAQETIKMITKQYVPVKGYCTIDLISSETTILNA